MHLDIGEYLAPELRQVIVDDGNRRQAGVDHLQHVVVFEHCGGPVDHHGRLAARFQLRAQPGEAFVINTPRADEHLLPRQVIERRDRRRSRPGDHDLVHVGPCRGREGDDFFPLGRDRHHGRHHVDLAARQRGIQLIARHRQQHDVHFQVAGLQLRVQIVLERLQGLVRQSTLLPLVDEVVRAVEGHGRADHATLDHLVEITGERLVHDQPRGWWKRVERRRRRRDGRVGGRWRRGRGRRRRRRRIRLLLT